MFKMENKFPLTVLHGDFKNTRGHTLCVSTKHPDGNRALRLEMRTPTGEIEIMKAADIRRVARSESATNSKGSHLQFPMGINRQRLPIVCGVLALAFTLPVLPFTLKVIGVSIVTIALLLEPQVRVIVDLMDGRYVCAAMSERAFGMMCALCNQKSTVV